MLTFSELDEKNPKVKNMDFVVLDFETTGVNGIIDEIVELGSVRFSTRADISSQYSSLANPGISIPVYVSKIHGITDEDVNSSPKPIEIIKNFIHFSENSLLVAHNARFDGMFLQKYLFNICDFLTAEKPMNKFEKCRAELLEKQKNKGRDRKKADSLKMAWKGIAVLDTVSLSRNIFPDFPSHSLSNLKKQWGIETPRSHRGLDDAISAARVLNQCLSRCLEAKPDMTFRDLWQESPQSYITGARAGTNSSYRKQEDLHKTINNAITNGFSIRIAYQDNFGKTSRREISPIRLFFSYTEAYIEAFCYLRESKRVFKLDRLELY